MPLRPVTLYGHKRVLPYIRTGHNEANVSHEFSPNSLPSKASSSDVTKLIYDTYLKPYMVVKGGYKVLNVKQKQYLMYRIMQDLKKLKSNGCTVGVACYENTAKFQSWFGSVKGVQDVMSMMKTDAIMPTKWVFDSLLTAHSKSKDIEGWKISRKQMSRAGIPPTTTTYNSALYCNQARPDIRQSDVEKNAFSIYEAMMADGVKPNYTTLRALLASCRSFKTGSKVVRIFEEKHKIIAGNTNISLLRACRWKGELTEAFRVHKSLLESGHNTSEAWNALVMVAKCKGIKPVEEILRNMSLSGISPGVVTYSIIIETIAIAIQSNNVEPFSTVQEAVKRAELYFASADANGFGLERMLYDALSSVYTVAGERQALYALEAKLSHVKIPLSSHFEQNLLAIESHGAPIIRQKYLDETDDGNEPEPSPPSNIPVKKRNKTVIHKPVRVRKKADSLTSMLTGQASETPAPLVDSRPTLDSVLSRHFRDLEEPRVKPVDNIIPSTVHHDETKTRTEMLKILTEAIQRA
eukprot:TRINITY_DN16248_c2_g3_i1.p1 TRINITY_DN16248_c2_g3~~TRINITY_DN16248_c2_g3_i1.p1  ORF type:complete len:543 (+),score=59.05 TRINITY_DN16248_c2_g3_i1:62-1630(+)